MEEWSKVTPKLVARKLSSTGNLAEEAGTKQEASVPRPQPHLTISSSTLSLASTSRGRIYRCLPGPGAVAPASEIVEADAPSTPARFVTREIAALDFLMNIPLAQEREIVKAGVNAQLSKIPPSRSTSQLNLPTIQEYTVDLTTSSMENHSPDAQPQQPSQPQPHHYFHLHWWEKLIGADIHHKNRQHKLQMDLEEEKELELPDGNPSNQPQTASPTKRPTSAAVANFFASQQVAPGRRLDGVEPRDVVKPPKAICTMENLRGGRSVAVNSSAREWEELHLAHGISAGRIFFSVQSSYPLGVFSMIPYEPKKEEAVRRRKKLEQMGGGGSQFVIPARDWRGVSYAALLKSKESNGHSVANLKRRLSTINKAGPPNTIQSTKRDSGSTKSSDEDGLCSSSDESEHEYQPGFLDDPAMVQGRHRHVMVGDKVTGPIVSSVIQFVDPVDLKKDLNKQFRDRFEGWEPPPSQRKYIGAQVVNGVYTLLDPTTAAASVVDGNDDEEEVKVQTVSASVAPQRPSSMSQQKPTNSAIAIRMPPSLTLSKIRSLKHRILLIGLKSQVELSTIALSYVYFERLCLDCRVDKSNRHLSFAACLLLAYKTNEPNVAVITTHGHHQQQHHDKPLKESKASKAVQQMILQTFVQPAKKSVGIFAFLLDTLTNEFALSLKHLFAAEWGVFVALGFRLHAKPSQVTFHFRRILKKLERNALAYLGEEMYNQWQQALSDEVLQVQRHADRRQARRERRQRKLMKLQRKALKQQKSKQKLIRRHSSSGSNSVSEKRENDESSRPETKDMVVDSPMTNLSDTSNNLSASPRRADSDGSKDDLQPQHAPRRNSLKSWAGNKLLRHEKLKKAPSETQPLGKSQRVGSTLVPTGHKLPSPESIIKSNSSPHLLQLLDSEPGAKAELAVDINEGSESDLPIDSNRPRDADENSNAEFTLFGKSLRKLADVV